MRCEPKKLNFSTLEMYCEDDPSCLGVIPGRYSIVVKTLSLLYQFSPVIIILLLYTSISYIKI